MAIMRICGCPSYIKYVVVAIAIMFTNLSWHSHQAEAQALRIVASNTFAGSFTGAMLGGAQMALHDDDDTTPLRYGVGIGTLAGLAVGAYDAGREAEYIYGAFRRTRHTGSIIMMDTFLGSATGAAVGMAVALLRDDEIVDGLRYGSGVGAWAGFGFGLIDGFLLSEYGDAERGSGSRVNYQSGSDTARGVLILETNTALSVGFLYPSIYSIPVLQNQQLKAHNRFGLELTHVSISL